MNTSVLWNPTNLSRLFITIFCHIALLAQRLSSKKTEALTPLNVGIPNRPTKGVIPSQSPYIFGNPRINEQTKHKGLARISITHQGTQNWGKTHDSMNPIPHSAHELECTQPSHTPQNNKQISFLHSRGDVLVIALVDT